MSLGKLLSFGLDRPIAAELVNGQSLSGDPRRFLLNLQNAIMDDVINPHVEAVNAIVGNTDLILDAKNRATASSVEKSLAQVESIRSGSNFAGLETERGSARAERQRARAEIIGAASEARQIELRALIRAMDESTRGQLLLESKNRNDATLLSAILSASQFENLVPESLLEESVTEWLESNRPGLVERVQQADAMVDVATFNLDEADSALREPVMSGNKLGAAAFA
jgi:hypothetical protein